MVFKKGVYTGAHTQPASVFVGLVISSNSGSRAVTVVREGSESSPSPDMGFMLQGIPVSSVMSSFFGFKEATLPQPGTKVLCVSNTASVCYIIGSIPKESMEAGKTVLPGRTMLGAKNALDDEANRIGHAEHLPAFVDAGCPTDVVDGEHVVSNDFGVLLGLYQQLAVLKASELAQIQCFLLDDLVRIISHNFQHYTALGEYNVFHDGKRLMAEFGATHKVTESYGSPAVYDDEGAGPTFAKTSKHTVDDDKDFYEIVGDERIKAVERFKLFLGSVGDFLNLFLLRPDPSEKRYLDPEQEINFPDVGLCNLHVGTDGGVHLRSIKEVFIEKTNWIRVPVRKSAPDDPAGDDAETLEYTEKEKFEFNNDCSYKQNPFNYAVQIRDYVAYVNEKLGYQNFKAHQKDFFVNDDPSKEPSLEIADQIDKETKLNLSEYQLRSAGIYLMPNGGITFRDAWNSAIVMEGGNIYLQPAKDLVCQPLRHSVTKAGGHVNISARKDIDLSSSEEGFRLKSLKTMHLYSSEGGIVVESDGDKYSRPSPKFDSSEDAENTSLEYVGGIVLKSETSIYSKAKKDCVTYTGNYILQSIGRTNIHTTQDFTLISDNSTYLLASSYMLSCSKGQLDTIAYGAANIAGATGTNIGQKDAQVGLISMGGAKGVIDVVKSYDRAVTSIFDNGTDLMRRTGYSSVKTFDDIKFRFLASKMYDLSPKADGLPTTLPQQEDALSNAYELEDWKEVDVNGTKPYPGTKLFDTFYYQAEKPSNLEKTKKKSGAFPEIFATADATNEPCKISLESLAKYKVQKVIPKTE